MPTNPTIPTWVDRTCENCGNPFRARGKDVAHGFGRACSRRCSHAFKDRDFEARFWERVGPPSGPKGCREWTGSRVGGSTYGKVERHGKTLIAHRVAWELTNGPIPDGLDVCHWCDNPPCCEPSHFFLGTDKANKADSIAKGRHAHGDTHPLRIDPSRAARGDRHGSRLHPESLPTGDDHWARRKPECLARGEANGFAKLTRAQAREIRARYAAGGISQTALAADFGVNQTTISRVVRGSYWRE